MTILRQRDFALLWTGGLVSSLGDWFLFIALPFYIYDLTGSALATGGMFVAESLPTILVGSLAGVFVDRWNRRRTMIVSDVGRGVLLLVLLAPGSADRVWLIFAVVFVQSSIGQFFGPAKSALIPRIVAESDLVAANSLTSLSGQVVQLVGPILGGAVLGLFGLAAVVSADAASFFFSAGMVALLRASGAVANADAAIVDPARPVARVWREFLVGARLMGKSRLVRALLVTMGLTMLGQGIINVMLVPFVKDVLHGDALVLGWLASVQGVGGIAGGVLIGIVGPRIAPRWLIAAGLLATGLLFVAAANAPWLWLVLTFVGMIGFTVIPFGVGTQTLLQIAVEDRFRGRVFGAYNTIQSALMLVGMVLASALARPLGTVPTLDLAGACTLLAGAVASVVLPARAPTGPAPATAAALPAGFEE